MTDYRKRMRPVQLFVPSSHNSNTLRLNKSALNEVLGHSSLANKKIVIISVSGAYKKGKSFLLNFFLEYLYILQYSQKNDVVTNWLQDETQIEGFNYRCGLKKNTTGIWIWAEPILINAINGERYAVILMDTQGCFEQAPNSCLTNNTSHKNNNLTIINEKDKFYYPILALSTMLSSIQIYNVGEFLPEEAINSLSFCTNYEKLVCSEAPQLGKPFQKLIITIRDFKVSEEIKFGLEGGSKILEKTLEQNFNNQNYQDVKQNIKKCFIDGLSCCLLPNPGPRVTDLSNSFRGAEYSRIFDSNQLGNIRSVLNANLQLICADYADEAKSVYCKGMNRATRSNRMIAEKKLLEAHIKHGIKALNIYDHCPKVDSGDIRNQNLAQLQESINNELEKYKQLNKEKRVTSCASALLACGDSVLFGLSLCGVASGATVATVFALQIGMVSAGVLAIPVSLGALFGIWVYTAIKPTINVCLGIESP